MRLAVVLVLFSSACSPVDDGPAFASGGGGLSGSFELNVAEEAPSVLVLSWGADVSPDAVEVSWDAGDGWQCCGAVDLEAGEALITGLPPDTWVDVRAEVTLDGVVHAIESLSEMTGSLDLDLPSLAVEADQGDALDGGLVLTTTIGAEQAIVALDGRGRVVWWRLLEAESHVTRVRLARDGRSILTLPAKQAGGSQDLVRYDLQGREIMRIAVPDAHHDFVELRNGTLAFLVSTQHGSGADSFLGDAIVEVAADGSRRTLWSAVDAFEFQASDIFLPENEWSHANWLSFDDARGEYIVGLYGLRAIAGVDSRSGETTWVLGGDEGDFVDATGTPFRFQYQHGAEWTEDGLLVFENGSSNNASSRVVELDIDPDDPSQPVTALWSWAPSPAVYTPALGNASRLGDGTTLVNFATAGRIVQVDDAGDVRWSVSTSLGSGFGYAEVVPALGPR